MYIAEKKGFWCEKKRDTVLLLLKYATADYLRCS